MTLPPAPEIVALLLVGLSAGFLAGLLGVGGGILLVPAMVLLLGFEQHVAQGTSLVVIIPAAISGTVTHRRRGRLSLKQAAAIAAGGVVGAVLGSSVALSLDEVTLRRLFALLLVVIALRILATQAGLRRPWGRTTEEPLPVDD